jgi:hypothetical protein
MKKPRVVAAAVTGGRLGDIALEESAAGDSGSYNTDANTV